VRRTDSHGGEVMTRLREHDIPEHPAPPRPTRYTRGLTREARLRLGLEREPINWGDFTIAILIVTLLLYLVVKHVVLA